MQLEFDFTATEKTPNEGDAESTGCVGVPTREMHKVVKVESSRQKAYPARMEEVADGLQMAFQKVAANKGAPGPDGLTIQQVESTLQTVIPALRVALLEDSYQPGSIRRVNIPKPGGGSRGLGIPNVIDRVVQEAMRAVLERLFEPQFHPNSHGFRPKRGCHTAIAQARDYVKEGCHWIVDMDLEKFFDRVHHQRLMSKLALQVDDQRITNLLWRMLKAETVLPNGLKIASDEGVPQGGPLSPLLSNIVLDELDWELNERGLRFVRYADDCNIYVRSERAGKRVLTSIERFINRRLRLRLNAEKSAVARPETRHFLGFRLRPQDDGSVEVLLSERSKTRLARKVRELTPRYIGRSLEDVIFKINQYTSGWLGHFRVCTLGIRKIIRNTDSHLRRRLRAIILTHWKNKRTIIRRLIALGVREKTVRRQLWMGRKSTWALSINVAVHRGLSNMFFLEQGLKPLTRRFETLWKSQTLLRETELANSPVVVNRPALGLTT